MSFLATSKKLANSKLFYSLAAAGSVLGLAMSYNSLSTPVLNEQQKTFTGDGQWIDLKLVKSWDVSHNTKHFLFSLPSPDQVSGLETASCLLTKFKENKEGGKNIIRPYTPISPVDQKGEIELVIKKYEDGKMSNHLFGLKPNDTLSFKGPILKWKWEPNQFKEIALIGAGTGITPLYQLLHEISRNPEDKTKVTLFYGNVAPEDVLIKKEIDVIANKNPDQIKVNYFVDKPVADWYGHTGFITVDFLKSHLPKPSSDVKVFVCGPPPFYKALSGTKVSPSDQGEVSGALAQLGFTKDQVYKF